MDAVDDTLSLGTNDTAGVVNVLANDTPTGSDIWITEFEFDWGVITVAPAVPFDGGLVVELVEDYGSEGEYLGLAGQTKDAIDAWKDHQKNQIDLGYEKAIIAVEDTHAFLTQWSGTGTWLYSTAGNTIWALSGYLGGTAAGVGGMALAAMAAFYDDNPNGTDAQALTASKEKLEEQRTHEKEAIDAFALQLKNDVNDLMAALGNPEAVSNQTFTYSVEGYIGDPEEMIYGNDTATVTVDLGGRFDYSGHIYSMQALKDEQWGNAVGTHLWQGSPQNVVRIEGEMLEVIAEMRGFDLHWNQIWYSSDWDFWFLDGSDIADRLNFIDY